MDQFIGFTVIKYFWILVGCCCWCQRPSIVGCTGSSKRYPKRHSQRPTEPKTECQSPPFFNAWQISCERVTFMLKFAQRQTMIRKWKQFTASDSCHSQNIKMIRSELDVERKTNTKKYWQTNKWHTLFWTLRDMESKYKR